MTSLPSVLAVSILLLTSACNQPGTGEQTSGFAGKADRVAGGATSHRSPPVGQYSLTHPAGDGDLSSLELKAGSSETGFTGDYIAVLNTDDGTGALSQKMISGPYKLYKRRLRFDQPRTHKRTVPLLALFRGDDPSERIARWVVSDLTENSGFIALSTVENFRITDELFLDFVASGSGEAAINIECELDELIDDNVFEGGLGEENEATGISVFRNPVSGVINVDIGDASWASDDDDLESVELTADGDRQVVASDFGDGDIIKLTVTGATGRVEARLGGATTFSDVATLRCE